MKKIIRLVIAVIIISLLVFICSCNKTEKKNNELKIIDGAGEQFKNVTDVYNKYIKAETADIEEYKRAEAPLKKNTKNKQTVEYSVTKEFGAVAPIDIYTDDSGSDYYYNTDGILISFLNKSDELDEAEIKIASDPESAITQEKAKEIAENFAKENFAELYEGYELISEQDYSFMYAKRCGSDNYIIAQTYVCDVSAAGTVRLCSISNPQNFEGFDADTFKDVSKEDIENAAIPVVKEAFGDKFVSCEIRSAYIGRYNDNYVIKASYTVTSVASDNSQIESVYEVILQP